MRKVLFYTVCSLSLVAALMLGCNTTQSPEQQADDATITTQVKSKLATDVELATVKDIEVNTTNGVVTLAGQVATEAVKRRAEEVTKQVEGVVRVTNNLQVEPGATG
jgi:hyperosmotically inducible protein